MAGEIPVSHANQARRHAAGFILLFLAGALWSLNGAFIKLIYKDGEGPGGITIAFYRSLVAGVFLLPLAWGRFRTLRVVDESGWARWVRPAAVACVVFFALMTATFVIANTMTEAANAIILQYTSTFWIFGLSPLVLGERANAKELWIVMLAMVGVGIIFAGKASTNVAGLTVALAAGFFYALLTLMIRVMRDSDSAAVTVLNNLGSALLLLPAVLLFGQLSVSSREAALLVLMGVVQFGFPYYLYTLGLARVPAYQAALITMIEPVLVPVWTYLAVGETVPGTTLVGGAAILIALVWFVQAARKTRIAQTVAAGAAG